jgi:flagellar hook-associated protein 3 FlgL
MTMIGRTTSTQMLQQAQRNMQTSLQQLARLNEQATSQHRISRPSDDPAGTGESLRVRGEQSALDQYQRNVTDGLGWLAMVDTTLSNSSALIQKARNLVVQGSNDGVLSAESREALAVELEGIRDDLRGQANTSFNGRYLFAGTSDTPPFDAAYAYSGTAGSSVERRISADTTIRVDADGAAAFGAGATSVFATLDSIVTGLRAGTSVSGRLDDLDAALQSVLTVQSVSGSAYAQMERAEDQLMSTSITLEGRRASVEDVDLAEVLVQLSTQQVAYQTALGVTARALQPTLMSFLA